MANIVISRIQNRRGRRENLPQPLLPGEVALTSDTGQAWIGQDPTLAASSVNVYSDKLEATAQSIIDSNITEVRFGEGFNVTTFNALSTALQADGTITVVEDDILWDATRRGEILSVTVTNGGTGYVGGGSGTTNVIAVSATGSGFIGTATVVTGVIQSVTVVSGGSNYQTGNTVLTPVGGNADAVLTLAATDLWDSTVHVAGNTNIDANNTITNIKTAVTNAGASVTSLLSTTDTAGGWPYGDNGGFGGVDRVFSNNSLIVDNHTESANVVSLVNRVNGSTPGEVTGLTYTNLNIEITGGTNAGAVVLPYEAGYYFEGIILAPNALKSLHVVTQDVTFASGVASEAYANIPITAAVTQVFDLQKNGVSFGSVTFSQGVNAGVVTIGASTSFTKGDRLEVFGPASPDGVLDQISITLTGTITV